MYLQAAGMLLTSLFAAAKMAPFLEAEKLTVKVILYTTKQKPLPANNLIKHKKKHTPKNNIL